MQGQQEINSAVRIELLLRLAEASDRLTDLRKAIDKVGVTKAHQLLRQENAARAQLMRGLRELEKVPMHARGNG